MVVRLRKCVHQCYRPIRWDCESEMVVVQGSRAGVEGQVLQQEKQPGFEAAEALECSGVACKSRCLPLSDVHIFICLFPRLPLPCVAHRKRKQLPEMLRFFFTKGLQG